MNNKSKVQVVNDLNYNKVLDYIDKYEGFGIDIETTGFDIPPHSVLGFGLVGFNVDVDNPKDTLDIAEDIYYIPITSAHEYQSDLLVDTGEPVCIPLTQDKITVIIDKLSSKKYLAGHNLKFDLHGLTSIGLNVSNDTYTIDTRPLFRFISQAEKMGQEDFSLDVLMTKYLGKVYARYKSETLEDVKRRNCNECGRNHVRYDTIPFPILKEYCGRDALAVVHLVKYLWTKHSDLNESFKLQYAVTRALYDIETLGIKIDTDYIHRSIELLNKEEAETNNHLLQVIQSYSNVISEYWQEKEPGIDLSFIDNFTYSKPRDIDKVMVALGYSSTKKTEKGKANSWSLETLAVIDHMIPALIVKLKKISKFKTFFTKYEKLDVAKSNFNNAGTVTGRLSSSNPNLQQLPSGTLDFDHDKEYNPEALRAAVQADLRTDLSGVSDKVIETYKFLTSRRLQNN